MRGYMQWVLRPGESIERTALHNDFGGGRQGGISPSRQTQAKPLSSDLYVGGVLLVEAKGTIERGAVRMALGQLLDYGRFVPKEVRRDLDAMSSLSFGLLAAEVQRACQQRRAKRGHRDVCV